MKARPILFSGPMVRALLEGRKTQTRRILNSEQDSAFSSGACFVNRRGQRIDMNPMAIKDIIRTWCSYGKPGDLLWVRETLWVVSEGFDYAADGELAAEISDSNADLWARYAHEEGPDVHPTRIPSIFMPRWASRLTLRITDVRVQRLQDISAADAKAEGSDVMWDAMLDAGTFSGGGDVTQYSARDTFRDYIDLLNKNRGFGWATNPWMWALTFEVIKANVDQVLKEAA